MRYHICPQLLCLYEVVVQMNNIRQYCIFRAFKQTISIIILCLSIHVAMAADLLMRPTFSPSLPAAFDWTGFYAGVNAGYGLDHFAFPYVNMLPGVAAIGTGGIDSSGAVAGGQIGFNYRFSNLPFIGHAVTGIEVDSDWSGIRGTQTVFARPVSTTFGTKFENFGTARLRFGYDFDRLLVYMTGGLTYGTTNTFFIGDGFAGSVTNTHTGLPPRVDAVGLGAEYALTNNFTLKAEYLYDCIQARFVIFPGTVGFTSRSMYHIARLGLNYKFDWPHAPGPVTAKY
jgi:outer membrane immunogenic protein